MSQEQTESLAQEVVEDACAELETVSKQDRNIFLNRERKRDDNLVSQISDIQEEISFVDKQIEDIVDKLQTVNQGIQEIQEFRETQQLNQIDMSSLTLNVDFEIEQSSTLKQTLQSLQDEISSAKKLYSDSTQQIKFVEEEHSKVRNHKTQLFQKLDELKREQAELTLKEETLEYMSALDRKITSLQGNIDNIQIRNSKIMDTISYKKQLLQKLQNDLCKLQSDSHQSEEDISQYQEEYNQINDSYLTINKCYKNREAQRTSIKSKIEAQNLPVESSEEESISIEYDSGKYETRLDIVSTDTDILRLKSELSQRISKRYLENESQKTKKNKETIKKPRESYEQIIAYLDQRYTILEQAAASRRAQLELEHQQYLVDRSSKENELDQKSISLRQELVKNDAYNIVQRVEDNKKKIEDIKNSNERRKENLKSILSSPGMDTNVLAAKEISIKEQLEAAEQLKKIQTDRKLVLERREGELVIQEEMLNQEKEQLAQKRKLVELKTLENQKMIDMYKKLGK